MQTYIWRGEETNLGRFGNVKAGDVLELTQHESDYVTANKDKRFVPHNGKPVELPPLPEDEKLRKAEIARREALAGAQDRGRLAIQEIREMNRSELLKKVEFLNEAGAQIRFAPNEETGRILALVLNEVQKRAHDKAVEESEPAEPAEPEAPTEPAKTEVPETPSATETPEQPQTPAQPELPAQTQSNEAAPKGKGKKK